MNHAPLRCSRCPNRPLGSRLVVRKIGAVYEPLSGRPYASLTRLRPTRPFSVTAIHPIVVFTFALGVRHAGDGAFCPSRQYENHQGECRINNRAHLNLRAGIKEATACSCHGHVRILIPLTLSCTATFLSQEPGALRGFGYQINNLRVAYPPCGVCTISGLCDGPGPPSSHRFSVPGTEKPL
jgi:hypothetical protein